MAKMLVEELNMEGIYFPFVNEHCVSLLSRGKDITFLNNTQVKFYKLPHKYVGMFKQICNILEDSEIRRDFHGNIKYIRIYNSYLVTPFADFIVVNGIYYN